MSLRDNASVANRTVDLLGLLARIVDPVYAEECADSGCTNRPPETDAEKVVSLLSCLAQVINSSGMCDSGMFEQFVNYPAEHGWRTTRT